MSKEAEIETNDLGGKGSVTEGGFHLGFPARGVLIVSGVVKEGAKRYAVNNWRLVTPEEHYNHAVEHLMRLGDPNDPGTEDHAAHAACRLLMFLETRVPGLKLAWQTMPAPVTRTAVPDIDASMNRLLRQLAGSQPKPKVVEFPLPYTANSTYSIQ